MDQHNQSGARVFTFGVGYDLDVELLDHIADAAGGARDYVAPQEELEIVTSRFFAKVGHPVLTDVAVDFGTGVTGTYPRKLPDLFAGDQLLVFGRYATPGARQVTLSGKAHGKTVTHTYDVDLAATDRLPYLPRLWAHRKVAFLIDDIRLNGPTKEVVDEVVRLATRHGIVTPYTSGLVVEESELGENPPLRHRTSHQDAPRRRSQPVPRSERVGSRPACASLGTRRPRRRCPRVAPCRRRRRRRRRPRRRPTRPRHPRPLPRRRSTTRSGSRT